MLVLTASGLLLGFTSPFSVLERELNRHKQCIVGGYALMLMILFLAQLVLTILAFRWRLAWWAKSLALLALTASFLLARWWAFGDGWRDSITPSTSRSRRGTRSPDRKRHSHRPPH